MEVPDETFNHTNLLELVNNPGPYISSFSERLAEGYTKDIEILLFINMEAMRKSDGPSISNNYLHASNTSIANINRRKIYTTHSQRCLLERTNRIENHIRNRVPSIA